MKLRTKIQIYSSLVVLIVIVLINTAIFLLFYKITIDAEVDRVKSQTRVIMEALASSIDTEVNPTDLLKAYIPSNGMIRVIDEEGKPIHTITKKTEFYRLPASYVQVETHKVMKWDEGKRFLSISVPLIWENGEVVTLQVTEELKTLQKTMSTLFFVLLFASLIMIIPTVIGGASLSRFLLKPIQQLTKAMTENPKQGNWRKINLSKRSKDELFQMGSAYNRMIDRLNESFAKQEQFVSNASHELKTPISIIKSYAQLLERWGKEKPEVFKEATDAIQTEVERMESMTEQLLALAKNNSKESLRYEKVNLVSLIQGAVKAFDVAYNRTVKLITDVQKVEINCDRDKIKQVLYILLDNARKYSDGEIHVSLNQTLGKIELSVKDFGEGLSEEELNRIFDRFYRVDKARSRETGGTGLGLSIAQSIVKAHGGKIVVQSKEGEGTIFTVLLPH